MDLRSLSAALVLFAVSAAPSTATENYKSLGERPASGEMGTALYAFSYELPQSAFKAMGWKAFSDLRQPRNLIMVTGLHGHDTYALSVLFQGTASAGQDALSLARQKYPDRKFSAGPNPACANTSLDRPFSLTDRMVSMMAVCVDKSSMSIYELVISWQALILVVEPIDQIVQKSRLCAEVKSANPEARCPDRIGEYTRSFNTFLSTFTFSGK